MAQVVYGQVFTVAFNALLTTHCVDQAFWTAPFPCEVVGVTEIHAVAGNDAGTVKLQLERLQGTEAPESGDDLLTNNTNTGFDCKGTANTLQTGTLVGTSAVQLAAGNRLGAAFTGTVDTLAGLTMTVTLKPIA